MPIFNSIKEKIFGKAEAEPAAPAAPATPAPSMSSLTAAAGAAAPKPSMQSLSALAAAAAAKVKPEPVDVEAVIEAAVKAKGIKLNWRTSIVDLMKALDLDSSLAARRELAADLKYSGPHADGSAEKNIWLHKELMKQLAENGGKVPADLLK